MTASMHVHRQGDLSWVNSALSCDTFNIIHLHGSGNVNFPSLEKTVDYFRSNNLAFCIWVNEHTLHPVLEGMLTQLSVHRQAAEAGMELNLDTYKATEDERHRNIVEVTNEELLAQYAQVIADNWNPSDMNVVQYYKRTAAHYLDMGNQIKLLIYLDQGQPVSTLEVFSTDQTTVGLYGFATLEEYRGKGIGTTLMTYALNKAREEEVRRVVLQASEDGLNIYKRLGFEQLTTYYEYA